MDLQKTIKDSLYFGYKVAEDDAKGFATNLQEIGGGFENVKVFLKPDCAFNIVSDVVDTLGFPQEYAENINKQMEEGEYGVAYGLLETFAQQEGLLEPDTSLIHLVFSYFSTFKECALYFGLTQEDIFDLLPEEKAAYEEEQARLKAEEDARIKAEEDEKARLQAEADAKKAEEEARRAEEAKELARVEEARIKAEEARLAAEQERQKADEERIKQEESRIANEEKQLEFEKAVNERVNTILDKRMKEQEAAMSSDVNVDIVHKDNKELREHVLTLEEKLDKLTSMVQQGNISFVPIEEEEPDEPLSEEEFINVIDLLADKIPNSEVLRPIILLYKSGEILEASYLLDNLLSRLSEEGVSFE